MFPYISFKLDNVKIGYYYLFNSMKHISTSIYHSNNINTPIYFTDIVNDLSIGNDFVMDVVSYNKFRIECFHQLRIVLPESDAILAVEDFRTDNFDIFVLAAFFEIHPYFIHVKNKYNFVINSLN